MTGSGNSMRSSTTGLSGSQSVSPVIVSFRPASATMSPVIATVISSLLFACISRSLPILSFLSLLELRTYEPAINFPEYMRTNVSDPTNGSVMILNANPENGSSSLGALSRTSSGSSGSVPFIAGRSRGHGK
uniref:Translation elongation factor G, putative n=1 Tax=Arundo donax TaxID=35708 RepID=A0A0A9IEM7_ARUDO